MPNRYGAQMKAKRKKRSSGPGSLDQDPGTNAKKTSHIVTYDIRNGQRSHQPSVASSVMPNPTATMRKSPPKDHQANHKWSGGSHRGQADSPPSWA